MGWLCVSKIFGYGELVFPVSGAAYMLSLLVVLPPLVSPLTSHLFPELCSLMLLPGTIVEHGVTIPHD